MSKILDFFFGKAPKIFDSKGNVVHKLSDERWKSWRARFDKNPELDWHQHKGTERIPSKPEL